VGAYDADIDRRQREASPAEDGGLHRIALLQIFVEAELFDEPLHRQSPYLEDLPRRRAHLGLGRGDAVREGIRSPICAPAVRPDKLREGREAR
jgi:hypothetical protein